VSTPRYVHKLLDHNNEKLGPMRGYGVTTKVYVDLTSDGSDALPSTDARKAGEAGCSPSLSEVLLQEGCAVFQPGLRVQGNGGSRWDVPPPATTSRTDTIIKLNQYKNHYQSQ